MGESAEATAAEGSISFRGASKGGEQLAGRVVKVTAALGEEVFGLLEPLLTPAAVVEAAFRDINILKLEGEIKLLWPLLPAKELELLVAPLPMVFVLVLVMSRGGGEEGGSCFMT